ncbi:hypothetical protein [Spirosoma montaniterrae]|uniref:DUF2157 domain-containing protein n=1 Tax=Spirosoma montaniterrae TaxID=1178516 RepID=A0A1P9WX11_9BACT|nr:hypothetical protein [Spirosoma montaniterrae]AQG79858.1 hypothetical protein AWR27_11290 [Spirosoma montaniterrae]
MKAYNEQWIENRAVVEQAERWHRQRLLTDSQLAAIRPAYPFEFRQTNGFVEIGLFLFTVLVITGVYLLLMTTLLTGLYDNRVAFGVINIGIGVGLGFIGRYYIQQGQLYRNGTDNAFAVMTTSYLAFGLNLLLPEGLTVASYCLLTLPLLLLALWYYGDTLLAFATLTTFYVAVFDGMLQVSWGKAALPFVMMGVSGLLYWLARRPQMPFQKLYYLDSVLLAQWISLIVLAAAGNYFVVRELNGLLLDVPPGQFAPESTPEIALPALFWFLTFALPVFYGWRGLLRKDRIRIILGALGLIAAVMTLHEYVALLPLNVALTLGGLVLVTLAVAGIRYLRTDVPGRSNAGFVDTPNDDSPDTLLANLQTIAAIQAASGASHGSKDNLRFGDGNFGGGGGEGRY